MKVTEIVVGAARTFNHPYENYSNLKPSVTLKATVSDGEDADKCVQDLQAKAEKLVEEHKHHLLHELERLERLTQTQQQVSNLEAEIKRAQQQLEAMRQNYPEAFQTALPMPQPEEGSERTPWESEEER